MDKLEQHWSLRIIRIILARIVGITMVAYALSMYILGINSGILLSSSVHFIVLLIGLYLIFKDSKIVKQKPQK